MSQGLARDFFTTASGLAVRGGGWSLYQQVLAQLASTAALYDPSDLTSLYQSRTGGSTGAADAVVGIMLDKRQMGNKTAASFIAGQSNIWSNASASFAGESSQVSSGVYRIYSSAGANSYVANTGLLTVGAWYEVRFTIDTITTLGSGVRIQDSGEVFTTTGAKVSLLKADHAAMFIKRNSVSGTTDIQISGVQVRAIPGYHALAPSDAAHPILRQSGSTYYLDCDGTDDWMQVFPTLNLGEQWAHVGGWQSDANSKFIYGTSSDYRDHAVIVVTSNKYQVRNTADSAYSSVTGAATVTSPHVLTVEKASTPSISGRINGANAATTTDVYSGSFTDGLALFNARNTTYQLGLDGRFYGGIWQPGSMSSELRSLCERWAASKCGVSL